ELFRPVYGDSRGEKRGVVRADHQQPVVFGVKRLARLQDDQAAVHSAGKLVWIGSVRVIDERPGATGREAGDEARTRLNGRRDLIANAASHHAIVVAVEFYAMPVDRSRCIEAVHYRDLRRFSARHYDRWAYRLVLRGHDLLSLTHRAGEGARLPASCVRLDHKVDFSRRTRRDTHRR